jgi:hypothetical protein
MPLLPANRALGIVEHHFFAQNRKVRLVRGQTEHDQISVEAVQDVLDVGRPTVLCVWMCVRVECGLNFEC